MSSSTDGNFYGILGIDPNSTPEEIKKAYKKRALQTHPDRLPQGHTPADKQAAEEEFRKVNNAYEVLINAENRKAYDLYGVWPPPEELPQQSRNASSQTNDFFFGFPDPFNNHPFMRSGPFYPRHTPFAFHDPFELFNAIFAEVDHDPFDPFSSRTPFSPSPNPFAGFFGHSPFGRPFSRSGIAPPSLFGRGFGNMLDIPEESNVRSYSYSSSSQGVGSGNGGIQWVSERRMQRTINGVTQTVHEKRDAQGNVHVRKVYPDGREQYTINGVEQQQPPRPVEGAPLQGTLPPPVDTSIPIRFNNIREEYVPHRDSTRDGRQDPPFIPPTHSHSRREKHRDPNGYQPPRYSSRGHRDHDREERRSRPYDYEPAPPPTTYTEQQPESKPKKHWWSRH